MPIVKPNCDVCNLYINISDLNVGLERDSYFDRDWRGRGTLPGDVRGTGVVRDGLETTLVPTRSILRSYAIGSWIHFTCTIQDIKCGGQETEFASKTWKRTPMGDSLRGWSDASLEPWVPDPNNPGYLMGGQGVDAYAHEARSGGGNYWTKGWRGDQAFTTQVCCGNNARTTQGTTTDFNCCDFMKTNLDKCCLQTLELTETTRGPCSFDVDIKGPLISTPWTDWMNSHQGNLRDYADKELWFSRWGVELRGMIRATLASIVWNWVRQDPGKRQIEDYVENAVLDRIHQLFQDCGYEYNGWFWPQIETHIKEGVVWQNKCRCIEKFPSTPTTATLWECPVLGR